MKRLLITGGSHAELPLIRSAKALGYFVITTGNNAEGLGHKEADRYAAGDFSDREFVYALAKRERVDAIVSGCNDFAYLSAAYAADKLGLKGHDSFETAGIIHHKSAFRRLTASLGIPTPAAVCCTDEASLADAFREIGFPLVVKPTDLTGGKGVRICRNEQEARDAFREAKAVSRRTEAVIEQFITGESYGCSVMLRGHKVLCSVFGNECYYKNDYLVSGACTAADLPAAAKERLCRDIETLSAAAGLCDGLFHTQFILDANGVPVMIDPCRRAPGDLYILFAKYATGADFPRMIVQAETGQPMDNPSADRTEALTARMCLMTDRNGSFGGLDLDPQIEEHCFDRLIWAEDGEPIENYLKYKAGILFLRYDTPDELYDSFRRFHTLARIRVK